MLGPLILTATAVVEAPAQGFAIGLASHGIGTARAFQIGEEAGAFSGLAMGLNAVATTLLLPVAVRVLGLN
jgi:putative effector of murein hydrolase